MDDRVWPHKDLSLEVFSTESKQEVEQGWVEGTTGYKDSVGQEQVFTRGECRAPRSHGPFCPLGLLSGLEWGKYFLSIPLPHPCMRTADAQR